MCELRKRYQQRRPRRNKDQRESGVWCMETKGSRRTPGLRKSTGCAWPGRFRLSPSFPRITCREAASPLSHRTLSSSHTTMLALLGVESWLVSPQKVCSKLWGLCEFPRAAATNDHKHLLTWVMSSQALALFLLLNHTDTFHTRIWFHDNKNKNKQEQKREWKKKNQTRCAQVLTP